MNRYLYQIGDTVCHKEVPGLVGVITDLVTLDEEKGEMVEEQNPSHPFYTIKWNDVWRAACRICDHLGLRARDEHTTHRVRLWVQEHTIKACLRCRNLLQEWPRP